jgi:hypothetical protein
MLKDLKEIINDDTLIIQQLDKEVIREHEDNILLKDNKIIGYKIKVIFYTKDFLKKRNDELIEEAKKHITEVSNE